MSVYLPLFSRLVMLVGACALSASQATAPSLTESKAVKFMVVGDMPYSQQEATLLRTDLREAIAAADVPFVIHYGDFKAGNDSCTDALFQQAHTDILSLHSRVFYTPGDNEWTDCDRPRLSQPQSELERLDKLRTLFFSDPPDEAVSRQENYPENARWWQDRVLFTTLHVVGTNNGRTQILKDDVQKAIAKVDARDTANQAWVSAAFAEAREQDAQSLVMVMQADIATAEGQPICSDQTSEKCDAYVDLRTLLRTEAAKFKRADQTLKPVLLVHGDTFPFCWDKKFGGDTAPNLWRFNAWGDFQQPSDVTAIAFHPDRPQDPFFAETLVNQVSPTICAMD